MANQAEFLNPSLVTIQAINSTFQDTIGTAVDADDNDYRKLCSVYNCSECLMEPFSRLNGAGYGSQIRPDMRENDTDYGWVF